VQMEIAGANGKKTWVRFTIREPHWNPGEKFWEYQLNRKDGAHFSGDSYFPEEDVYAV
jgi:hypothetical protein